MNSNIESRANRSARSSSHGMRCSCYFADRAWKEPYIPSLLPGKTLFVTLITSRQNTFIWGLSALSLVIRLPISFRLSCKPNDMERRDFFWCVHWTSVGLSVSFSGESILTDFPELAECGDRESRLNRSAAIGEHCICSELVESSATSPDLKNLINTAVLRILFAHFVQTRFEEESSFS